MTIIQDRPAVADTPDVSSNVRRSPDTIKEKAKLNPSKGVIPYLPEEVDELETEIKRFLKGDWPDEAEFTKYRLLQGVYGQRQPDAQMSRIKIPFGGLTADELDVLGQITEQYAPLKKGHVTTRQNIQIHHVKLTDTPTILRMLGEVGLTTREACGNTVRNVIGCPVAGVTPDEPFYVTPYLVAFARWFVRHSFSQRLPRKFKVAFESCANDCTVTAIHDLGFIPSVQVDEHGVEQRGFQMLAGGGTSIMARLAYTLYEFVPVEDYLRVSEAIIRVFDRTEELRKNKAKARIKFYIDRIGIDAFRQEVEEELKKPWARMSYDPTPLMEVPDEELDAPLPPLAGKNGHHSLEYKQWLETNVQPQPQHGYNIVWVKLPLGDIQAHQFPVLARIARDCAGSRMRTTTEQNLVFRWVPDNYLSKVWEELKGVGLAEPGANEITNVIACPGTDSCKLGITSSMGLAEAVGETLQDMAIEDPLVRSLDVKISGCPNGCARHHIASIGFHGAATRVEGNQVPAYELFIGGNYGNGLPARFGRRLKAKVPAKRAPKLMREFIHFYQSQRQEEESFNQFVDRVGIEPFEEAVSRFKVEGPLNKESLDTYLDWGKTVLYKVERGEGECAV